MSKLKPVLIIAIAIILAGGAALYLSKQSSDTETATAAGVTATPAQAPTGGRTRGPANAPVVLAEFGDYQCPSCGFYAPIVLELLKRYPKELRLEFHHFPLVQIHHGAFAAALAAEAAGEQNKFWEMHDMIYENQAKWSQNPNPESDFLTYAGSLGLDINAYMRAVRSPDTQTRIIADITRARDAQVNVTPTFFLNGEKVTAKINNVDEFSKLIQEKIPK